MPRTLQNRPGYLFVVPLRDGVLQGKWAHAVRDEEIGQRTPALCNNKPPNEALWVRRAPLKAARCPACVSHLHQIIGSAGGRTKAAQIHTEERPLREVGRDIRAQWKPRRRENLERSLRVIENTDKLEDTHEGMTGLQAVEYFLEHSWRVWRGKQTHGIKRELERLVRLGRKRANGRA